MEVVSRVSFSLIKEHTLEHYWGVLGCIGYVNISEHLFLSSFFSFDISGCDIENKI
jgi:hypothetical protein